jgi:osmotically-inducible protein OsmY
MMNPWVILGFVIAIGTAAGGGYYKGNAAGQAEIQQKWDAEKAKQYAEYAKAQEEARKREQQLQNTADTLRRQKDAEIRDINARATALSNSLRDRSPRPAETSTVSGTTSTGSASCSGKELHREDGEFLVGIAAEADRLKTALDQCTKQYNAARQK